MGTTGLLLIGFLVTHLAANLLVLVDADAFNHYGHSLTSNPLIYIAEVGLIALFVGHFLTGFLVERGNRAARPSAYGNVQRAGGKSRKSLASSTMILSGIVMLVFVPLHVAFFKFGPYYESTVQPGVRDLARLVIEEFGRPGVVAWYEFALFVLGAHAWHGIGSAFDSLGISHRSWIATGSRVLAVVLFGGFMIIPAVIYFGGAS